MRTQLLAVCTLSLACTASGPVHSTATATVPTPHLVFINPHVQVIADYDAPIFYTSNYYWRYDDGVWYRSPSYTSGWIRSDVVPIAIRRIDRPTAYIRYRGDVRASPSRSAPRETRPVEREREWNKIKLIEHDKKARATEKQDRREREWTQRREKRARAAAQKAAQRDAQERREAREAHRVHPKRR